MLFRSMSMAELSRRGVGTAVHYSLPVHRHPAYAGRIHAMRLQVTERIAGEVLSLPLYPELDEPEIRAVVDAVHDAARSIGRGGGEPSQRSS